jgi:hypothetical protein
LCGLADRYPIDIIGSFCQWSGAKADIAKEGTALVISTYKGIVLLPWLVKIYLEKIIYTGYFFWSEYSYFL